MEIEDNIITMVRGDSAILTINFMIDGTAYNLQNGDKAVFSVKKDTADTAYLINKELTGNKLVLQPADSKDLAAGKFVYDIQLTTAAGEVYTPLLGKIKILADVTRD